MHENWFINCNKICESFRYFPILITIYAIIIAGFSPLLHCWKNFRLGGKTCGIHFGSFGCMNGKTQEEQKNIYAKVKLG